ncbi:hypothetical protein HYW83_06780 [Candidatus Peregrinibacteria bacterium]|nr:hypothetical protein [Candidatus Peregrinibacteria bacterium]
METRNCLSCKSSFEITDRDVKYYEKIDVPSPTLCPRCRLQRRLAFRMERTLYMRNCDLSGKKMMSIIAPDSKYKAFSIDEWYSDRWNALLFGRAFDFNRPFFEQFSELLQQVPLLALQVVGVQNCDFVNQVGWSKDCYLIIEADYNESCLYSYRIFYSKMCIDCTEIFKCERCYECTDCENCFNVKWSQLAKQCADSAFLYDCRGCMSCFGCVGLRQKKYCFFNEQFNKEEYERRVAPFDFANPQHIKLASERFEKLKLEFPRKAITGEMNDNVSGNYIYQSKDCNECYGVRESRDCSHCLFIRTAKDCMDYSVWGSNAERIYESQACGQNIFNLRFCADCFDGSHDLTYCFQCVTGSNYSFGCIGLQKQQYCVFNKKYPQGEYEKLTARIIEHMKKTGEWGEFFPMNIAPYSYNETVAQEYFPLTKETAENSGLAWKENLPWTTGKETIEPSKIPLSAKDAPDSILKEVLACEATGRNYRITEQELKLYREMGLGLPRLHPDERHRRRWISRNPLQLWQRLCSKCGTEIQTTYASDRPEIVYCEACYLKTVY